MSERPNLRKALENQIQEWEDRQNKWDEKAWEEGDEGAAGHSSAYTICIGELKELLEECPDE